MSSADVLVECKRGMDIPDDNTEFDGVLSQKIMIVKAFARGAGVSDAMLADDLGIGMIVLGVSDLWNQESGEVKFSSAFQLFLNQLAIRSRG
ncbi:phage gp6-like head-tail connector protein [Alkalicella caledoniensis]|uniref:Phage gp6-like head-tail connector protein n=1 Tax=Alkalicella caledoniensis TaxID=2731377 RepID=A0A7G9W8B5_ALKCA|nr:phage gp6-like head-tail connector protein [Alkalicella caledoniensis]QNO14927.1 phage gp6-like head-tail connector protein [Alkalicella caledoniensis]